jgi:precorrin-4 methylase
MESARKMAQDEYRKQVITRIAEGTKISHEEQVAMDVFSKVTTVLIFLTCMAISYNMADLCSCMDFNQMHPMTMMTTMILMTTNL